MRKLLFLTIAFCLLLVSCAPKPAPVGWNLLVTKTSPPVFTQGALAYDTKAKEAVLFGGVSTDRWMDETWIWNGNTWYMAKPTNHPSARQMTAMAYDPARDRIVLFGGLKDQISFGDTWEWDGSNWKPIAPAHRPQNRCCHAMAYDPVTKTVLLYGGWSSSSQDFFYDTWEWDGTDWTEVTQDGTPPASGHAMVNFTAGNEIVALNTVDDYGTWAWDGSQWTGLSIPNPPGRQDARLVYTPVNKMAVLFGGSRQGEVLNDTWVFDGSAWFTVDLPAYPPARFGHVMFYDQKRKTIIMLGGSDNEGMLSGTWELKLPDNF